MELQNLSYSFFKLWDGKNWEKLGDLIHQDIKYDIFWCDLELEGKEDFIKALKKGRNSFLIRDIEVINSTECGDYSVPEWKGSHTNKYGKLESFKKFLVFNWDEKK